MSFINDFDVNTTPAEPTRNHANLTTILPLVSQTQSTNHKLIDPLPTTTLQLQSLNNNDSSTDIDNDDDCSFTSNNSNRLATTPPIIRRFIDHDA